MMPCHWDVLCPLEAATGIVKKADREVCRHVNSVRQPWCRECGGIRCSAGSRLDKIRRGVATQARTPARLRDPEIMRPRFALLLLSCLAGMERFALASDVASGARPAPEGTVALSGRVIETDAKPIEGRHDCGDPIALRTHGQESSALGRRVDDQDRRAGPLSAYVSTFLNRWPIIGCRSRSRAWRTPNLLHGKDPVRGTIPCGSKRCGRNWSLATRRSSIPSRSSSGMEFAGQVVTPLGLPAADVAVEFGNWSGSNNPSQHFFDDFTGRTDANGRIRIVMPKMIHGLSVTLIPDQYAPLRHAWGTDRPDIEPKVFASGRPRVRPSTCSSRVTGPQGPSCSTVRNTRSPGQDHLRVSPTVPGQTLSHHRRQGEFQFAHLRPGNYNPLW